MAVYSIQRGGWKSLGVYWLLVMMVLAVSVAYGDSYGGGTGDPNDPYQIWTAEQMNAIGDNPAHWGSHFRLMADIDLSGFVGTSFNMIGYHNHWQDKKAFAGVFDGARHTISGFSYSTPNSGFIGLFSYVGTNGEIKDIALTNVAIDTGDESDVGALVGYNLGKLTNCSFSGNVAGNRSVGGLVGINGGLLSACHTTGTVSGIYNVGGLVGNNFGQVLNCYSTTIVTGVRDCIGGLVGYSEGDIVNCYATGDVTGTGDDTRVGTCVGGLVGANGYYSGSYGGGSISGCYATGSVVGYERVGGLAGLNFWKSVISCSYATGSVSGIWVVGSLVGVSDRSDIVSCYATGKVTGDEYIGGLAGATNGLVYLSYWDIERTGQTTSAGGKGRSTAEMMSRDTYRGWGYDGMWRLDDGKDYPRLVWEGTQGQLLMDGPRSYGGGSGEPSDPYQIRTPEQLGTMSWYRADFDKHFMLMADLDMSGYDANILWVIGVRYPAFSGSFDGAGHSISNFTCLDNIGFAGLFGYVGSSGEINDLSMLNVNVDGGLIGQAGCLAVDNAGSISNCYGRGTVAGTTDVGGLVGGNTGTLSDCGFEGHVVGGYIVGGLVGRNGNIISRCYATGSVSGYGYVGGLTGIHFSAGLVSRSYASVDVSGSEEVGGLIGDNSGSIELSYATGTVSGWDWATGGFVGNNSGDIWQCYARGDVFGARSVGGLAGSNYQSVSECYASGEVTGTDDYVGGLVGYHSNNNGFYTSCFWNATVNSGLTDLGNVTYDPAGVIGETMQNMNTKSTYIEAGWDFITPVWMIDDGNDFPEFALTQNTNPVADAGVDRIVYAEISGIAEVELDGSGSYDENGDELSYLWTWEIEGETFDANGVNPVIELGVGEHEITLVVNDGQEDSEPNEVVVTVVGPVEVDVRVMPRVLNRKSRGRYVLAVMRLGDEIGGDDIDENYGFVLGPGGIDATFWRVLGRGDREIVFVMFDRARLIDATEGASAGAGGARGVEVNVMGRLISGEYIYGADVVRIIKPGKGPRSGQRQVRRGRR